jgi:hypothetical protein
MAMFEDALGGKGNLTEGQKLAVGRAAVLTAIAEDARVRKLYGAPDVTLDDLVRLDRTAALAVRSLDIDLRHTEAPQPSIRDVLAAEHEVRLAREEAETADDADEAADADPGEPEAAA